MTNKHKYKTIRQHNQQKTNKKITRSSKQSKEETMEEGAEKSITIWEGNIQKQTPYWDTFKLFNPDSAKLKAFRANEIYREGESLHNLN